VFAGALAVGVAAPAPAPARAARAEPRVLVFTASTGFRHDSIPAAVTAIEVLGEEHGFRVDTTEEEAAFTRPVLARYAAVVFVSTTGNPIPDAAPRSAFERYVERGGGFVGVHAASDVVDDWPWYVALVGARFQAHPPFTAATVVVPRHDTAVTAHLPARWERSDEWYDFQMNPRPNVRVLATVDDDSYAGSAMGSDHPIVWCHRVGKGRSVYTAMGHASDAYSEPRFRDHLLGAIQMAAGRAPFHCRPGSAR
jgi:type 1 glutamine amidotransferase